MSADAATEEIDLTLGHSHAASAKLSAIDISLAMGYGLALLACVSLWLLAVRNPLWCDETLAYWQIAAGWKAIWARSIQANIPPAYAYILWLTKITIGDRELFLRIPSILAMLAADYVFYRCAREMFDWDISLIAAILFILPRWVGFIAIDVRPYSFALLFTSLTILAFLHWLKNNNIASAALFGVAAAGTLYFHYLYGWAILALGLYYVLARYFSLIPALRHIPVALACVTALALPLLPHILYLYRTRATHVFNNSPKWMEVLPALHPGLWQIFLLLSTLAIAATAHRVRRFRRDMIPNLLLCLTLGLFPTLVLYLISIATTVHIFVPRYLLQCVPGMILFWTWVCSLIDSRALRALFCLSSVMLVAAGTYRSPDARSHGLSWKYALEYADKNTAADHATVLLCSPFVEGDHQPMPAVASESMMFAMLSYYKVASPVIPLPGTLNEETERQVKPFLLNAALAHQRFLLVAYLGAMPTVNFVADYSANTHAARVLERADNILVVEFAPRS